MIKKASYRRTCFRSGRFGRIAMECTAYERMRFRRRYERRRFRYKIRFKRRR